MRHAQTLPSGTFGRAYGDFMAQRGFHADDRPPVRFVDNEELAYVAMRSRETHDLWHVLFNCKTTVLGELALKAVEFVQVRSQATACRPIARECPAHLTMQLISVCSKYVSKSSMLSNMRVRSVGPRMLLDKAERILVHVIPRHCLYTASKSLCAAACRRACPCRRCQCWAPHGG